MAAEREFDLLWADAPVPAARALDSYSATEIGEDEIVLFDNERLTYHRLNRAAYAVWQLCDGKRTSSEISVALTEMDVDLSAEVVELAVVELVEAGMLLGDSTGMFGRSIDRRHAIKLATAVASGVIGIPIVKSITAPDAAAAATLGPLEVCTSTDTCQDGPGNPRCCCSGTISGNVFGLNGTGSICLSTALCTNGTLPPIIGGGTISASCIGG